MPIRAMGYLIAPIYPLMVYLCRQRCPRCNKRSLEGFLGREEGVSGLKELAVCFNCHASFRYQSGKWEYVGDIE